MPLSENSVLVLEAVEIVMGEPTAFKTPFVVAVCPVLTLPKL